ncbi:BTAD domain-containing putative transcriptional regulator [Nocardia sp. XZ_19_385]|uniref:BTAD domain-containing putative transcriptional regulator n=1 Tax=Nocardia sp. XZ_19_385 TaxID=2769488 RepID=UPI00189043C6|nr:BTAD domain-containing putative transcriptional regulator [Nocardia sp. XZ_19_385]
MRIGLLGAVSVYGDDGMLVEVGGVRVRMLLARLALAAGRPVSVDLLVDGLWGEEPPAEAAGALQALVSRLRKALRGVGAVELVAGGYRLSVRAEDVDAHRFEELAAQGRRELAAGRIEAAASVLRGALELWRGPALADVRDAPFAELAAGRLADLRGSAAADRFDAELRSGGYAEVLADLETAGAERPLSERLAGLRMRALAAAGRQSDALAVYEQIRERLGDELGVDPSAELREIHLALLRGELDRSAMTRTVVSEAVVSRIPVQRTSFVGREEELARVTALLAESRLVTLVGPGGAGKTRLSAEVVARHRAAQRGRVWFVPLAGVRNAGELADAVVGAVGARDQRTSDAAAQGIDRIIGLLDVGEAILVLDNCEHHIEAAAELADQLLEELPDLRILATSREPLAITGESLFPLGPLRIPSGTPDLVDAAESPAVRLFVDRAVAVRPDFVLDAATVNPVLEICRRLDGVPLALELAAAKLRSMSADQIAQRLDDRFRLLTTGSRTALPRQRTLLALVEWSWDLLDEPERALARRLSQFPGGATLDALEAVCSDDALPADDVVYVIGALVEKSVVEVAGAERYRMLETIRAYAAAQFTSAGDDLDTRFAAHYLAVAEANEPLLRTRDQLRALAIFDAEHENLVAALRSTLARKDAESSSRFVTALFWYWGIRGMTTQFETYLEQVLCFEDRLSERTRAAFRLIRLLAGTPPTESPILDLIADCEVAGALDYHPALLMFAAQLAYPAGDIDLGDRLLERALQAPDPWVRASAQWMRDYVHTEQGDLATGARARLTALRDFEQVGDRWGLGMALLAVGRIHSLRGEYADALALFERGVAVSAELGGEADIFQNRTQLIAERMRSGDLSGARRDIEAIQRRAKELGYRRLAAEILFSAAELHRRAGELDAANQAVDELETLADRLQLPGDMAADLIAGARMANLLAAGDAAGARGLLPQTLAGLSAWGISAGVAHSAELLAELLLLEGNPEAAATALGLSEAIRGAFDDGEPQLAVLISTLTEQLGEDAYQHAYRDGADLPRDRALERLAEL